MYGYKRARTAYDKVVKLASATSIGGYALMQTGRCWNQMGERDKALAVYRKFMDKPYLDNPYADDALVRAGVIEVSYKNDAKAGAEFFRYVVDNLQGGDMAPSKTSAFWRSGRRWRRNRGESGVEDGKSPDGC
jgi:hypothetical protein